MDPGASILLIFLAAVGLVAVVTLALFRVLAAAFGLRRVVEDGAVLTESGLEVLRFFGFGKLTLRYSEIEGAEILAHLRGPLATLLPRYRMSARWIGTRPLHPIVVIKLKGPRAFKYLLSTPRDALAFVEQLRSRIEGARSEPGPEK
jgi:hypothetical protein